MFNKPVKKIILCLTLCALSLFILTACEGKDKNSGASNVSSAADSKTEDSSNSSAASENPAENSGVNSSESEGSEVALPPSFARGALLEDTTYTEKRTDDLEPATITLTPEGDFEFKLVMYDGMPVVIGTYELVNDTYVMTPFATTAANINIDQLGEISFKATADGLVYSGETIGETVSGAEFMP